MRDPRLDLLLSPTHVIFFFFFVFHAGSGTHLSLFSSSSSFSSFLSFSHWFLGLVVIFFLFSIPFHWVSGFGFFFFFFFFMLFSFFLFSFHWIGKSMNQRGNYKHQTHTKETHIPIDYKLHLMSATCDSEDQGRSCNKLIDFGLHKLDPQSFFLASSVWVLGFFFLFS